MSSNVVRLADLALGRTISGNVYFKLVPPKVDDVGETDAAMAIGKGLINEALLLLKNSAEKEGFEVEVDISLCVY